MATVAVSDSRFDVESYLAEGRAKDILRFTTAGSVDDGKSTMIGRLLYDSANVYEDQIESVTKASVGRQAGTIDFSLLTDGLRAEREQGITIDVAYRYFATKRRKFIIADTPGHEQYTRNMVTGASTADLAIVLIDARKGVLPQSRRHAYIASLLGLSHLVVAVNKMDLVDYDEATFRAIENDFRSFLAQFHNLSPYFVPISALAGDNVVRQSENMRWFDGVSLLSYLETVEVGQHATEAAFRFPVQRVVRPHHAFRGYAGQIASGTVRVGDPIFVLPSGQRASIQTITTFDGELEQAQAPQSVTLTLTHELDIGRGDLISSFRSIPHVSREFDATVVWLNEQPLDLKRRYLLKHNTHQVTAEVEFIQYRLNINTLEHEQADTLEMNAVGQLRIETSRPLFFDSYRESRGTGSFILIDSRTNATLGAGMITGIPSGGNARRTAMDLVEHGPRGPVTQGERIARQGHTAAVIPMGKNSGLAETLERRLFERGASVVVIPETDTEILKFLQKSGFLILTLSEQDQDVEIRAEGSAVVNLQKRIAQLNEEEAAEVIYQKLEELRILLPKQSWSEGDGI